MKGKNIQPDEILVSLDVTFLFTNLPRELIFNGIERDGTTLKTTLNLASHNYWMR